MIKNLLKSKYLFAFRRFATYKGIKYTPITMPKLSPTATESKVEEWQVKEGDFIEAGDSYCTIETDKASLSHDAQEDGYVARIFKSDEKIPINALIGVQVQDKKSMAAFKDFKPSDYREDDSTYSAGLSASPPVTQKAESGSNITSEEPNKQADEESPERRVLMTPLARKLAKENSVDISKVSASGKDGEITGNDLSAFTSNGPAPLKAKSSVRKDAAGVASPNPGENYVDLPLTPMRETIAKRLLESKQTIPHFNVTMEIVADALNDLRKQLQEKENVKISVNTFIIKAAALALRKVKEVNSSWMGTFIRQFRSVDVSVAVSTDTGLITPIIKDADLKGVAAISSEMQGLAKKAREGKLAPNEFIGGTFTISNLGMMGVTNFTAIINPPQAAILAVGNVKDEVYFESADSEIRRRKILTVNLSCDHRVVDGAKAAEWLNAFKGFIEKPMTMLL